MAGRMKLLFALFSLAVAAFSCTKDSAGTPDPVVPPDAKLSYGDSIFYLKDQAADYIVTSNQTVAGRYTGYPEGIDIDANTGAINVSKSETGLRYRVSFKPNTSADSITTLVVISGVNFLDGFYKLNTDDSIARPIYNANKQNTIPGTNNGSIFDEGSNCNGAGCNVNLSSGSINLAQTVRNGVFGNTPSNNDRHEFLMNYRINDKSGKSLNTLKVKLYYYDSINDVPQEVYDIIADRQGTLLRNVLLNPGQSNASGNLLNRPVGSKKPRPPCIFILAR
jgi:hypothetical protein